MYNKKVARAMLGVALSLSVIVTGSYAAYAEDDLFGFGDLVEESTLGTETAEDNVEMPPVEAPVVAPAETETPVEEFSEADFGDGFVDAEQMEAVQVAQAAEETAVRLFDSVHNASSIEERQAVLANLTEEEKDELWAQFMETLNTFTDRESSAAWLNAIPEDMYFFLARYFNNKIASCEDEDLKSELYMSIPEVFMDGLYNKLMNATEEVFKIQVEIFNENLFPIMSDAQATEIQIRLAGEEVAEESETETEAQETENSDIEETSLYDTLMAIQSEEELNAKLQALTEEERNILSEEQWNDVINHWAELVAILSLNNEEPELDSDEQEMFTSDESEMNTVSEVYYVTVDYADVAPFLNPVTGN